MCRHHLNPQIEMVAILVIRCKPMRISNKAPFAYQQPLL